MCPPLEGLGGPLDYPGSGLVGLSSVKSSTRRQGAPLGNNSWKASRLFNSFRDGDFKQ